MRPALIGSIFVVSALFIQPAQGDAGCTVEPFVTKDMQSSGATLSRRLVDSQLRRFINQKINLPAALPASDIAVAHIWDLGRDLAEIIMFDRHGCYLAQGFTRLGDLLAWIDGEAI